MRPELDDDDAIERALRETEQRAFAKRERRFGADVIAWLAVAPVWPERVAAACSFPADLTVIGPALAAAGLARTAVVEGPSGEEERHHWMPAGARRDTLALLRGAPPSPEPGKQRRTLPEITATIAERLQGHVAELPPVLARWAELARSGWEADRLLRRTVGELVMAGDTGEALSWIDAARFLASATGGPLVTGVALAERQIELAYRREHDERLLRSFVEREEQIRWVNELLDAPDERWALHLLGVGGSGKTMLLRHVTSRLAAERGIVAVRIDFDHLSPDYPLRRPGQLVAALAGELRVHSTAHRHEYLFERLDSMLADLTGASGGEVPPRDPLANVRRPEVALLLRMFAEIVSQLPRPALFILDTCEELAKLSVPGAAARVPPAVEATFELLGELHRLSPSTRVLFAGRRFLASRGPGWEAISLAPEGTSTLPPRPFLALRELSGFDEGEADRLFEKMGLHLDAERRAAVLSRSREVAPPRVRRLDRPAGGELDIQVQRAAPARYHPFDLALYASWLQEQPDLAPEALQGDEDPYVERRILGRIESRELRAKVPFVVLLGRFDRATAAAALGLPDDGGGDSRRSPSPDGAPADGSLGAALRAIASQEWIDVQPDDESEGLFYELHRALWPRLWRFYSSSEERRAELVEAMRRAGPALAALARATPAKRIRAELIGAALRASRPVEGAALWADIEQRAAETGAKDRLREIGEALLAGEGPAGLTAGPLRRHATLLHVMLTCRGQTASALLAEEIEAARQALDSRPEDTGDPALWRWLRLRSLLVGATRSRFWASSGLPRPLSAAILASLPGALERERVDVLRLLAGPPEVAEEPPDEAYRALVQWTEEDAGRRAQAPPPRGAPSDPRQCASPSRRRWGACWRICARSSAGRRRCRASRERASRAGPMRSRPAASRSTRSRGSGSSRRARRRWSAGGTRQTPCSPWRSRRGGARTCRRAHPSSRGTIRRRSRSARGSSGPPSTRCASRTTHLRRSRPPPTAISRPRSPRPTSPNRSSGWRWTRIVFDSRGTGRLSSWPGLPGRRSAKKSP